MTNCLDFIKEYKNKHLNQECLIFGAGPSLKKFNQNFCKNKILMGSNEIIYYKIKMDYYMIGDGGTKQRGYYSDPDSYNSYVANFQKFCRLPPKNKRGGYAKLPENLNSFRYFETLEERCYHNSPFEVDKIYDVGTISLELTQFALICGFKKIYLVGQDCDYRIGSFHQNNISPSIKKWSKIMIPQWKKFKNFTDKYHKDVEIVNINPVGLKGVFREI